MRTALLALTLLAAFPAAAETGNDLVGKYVCDDGEFEITDTQFNTRLGDAETPVRSRTESYRMESDQGFTLILTPSHHFVALKRDTVLMLVERHRETGRVYCLIGTKLAEGMRNYPSLRGGEAVKATSALSERRNGRTVKYLPDYLYIGETPWVPEKPIGESVSFEILAEGNGWALPFNTLYFFNGFFEYDRLDLAGQNGRVTRLQVECEGRTTEHVFSGDPGLEQIILPYSLPGRETSRMKITILESVPGTKYQDVAISFVMYPLEREE